MNVEKCLKAWSRRRDGELKPREAERLDAKGPPPADVEASLRAWDTVGDLLRRQPVPTPPAETMCIDVLREIRLRRAQRREAERIRAHWNWAAIAATLVLVVGLGVIGLRPMSPLHAHAAGPVVEWVEPELPGSSAMVYEDSENGAVVIWIVMPEGPPAEGPT
ncbi:MAG: hypothetical protein NZ740_00015 [Kiritimatiellae bacterium]|nr:hypothetical protein [Kiritimatiellia bacterium]MDW8457475.1 hypothetical protein [Verrucomicrobiota bacterium]